MKIAHSRWSHPSSPASHKYEGSVSLSPDSSWKINSVVLRVVEVVKDVGLIPVGGVCQGAKTPQLAEAPWLIALALSTWKKRFRTEYR